MVKFLFCICSYKPEPRKCQLTVPFSFYPNFPTSKEGTQLVKVYVLKNVEVIVFGSYILCI